jgi:hypothetical protein
MGLSKNPPHFPPWEYLPRKAPSVGFLLGLFTHRMKKFPQRPQLALASPPAPIGGAAR